MNPVVISLHVLVLIVIVTIWILLGMFHRYLETEHDWQLIDKTILPSSYEQSRKADLELIKTSVTISRGEASNPSWVYRSTVVLTFKCSKTGAVKIVRKTNY